MTLLEIQSDPNYVNANAATKRAIFDKFSANDPNYTSANDATKAAIRQKFGVESTPKEKPAKEPEKTKFEKMSLGRQAVDVALGVPDYLANLATSIIAKPAGDLAGLAGMFTGDADAAAAIKAGVQDRLTYTPKTEFGKGIAEDPLNPINIVGEVIGGVSKAAGDVVRGDGAGADTVRGAAGNLVQEAIPQALGFVGMKNAPKIATGVQKAKDVAMMPSGYVGTLAKNAIDPVLPGGSKRAAARLANAAAELESGIPGVQGGAASRDATIAALKNARPGQTAAQAVADLPNAAEFTALEKVAGAQRGSLNFNVFNQQTQKLIDDIKDIAGNRGDKRAALRLREGETAPMRDIALRNAKTADTIGAMKQAQADALDRLATSKVEDVRRFTAAQPRAEGIARQNLIESGLPVGATKYTYIGGDLPKRAEAVAAKAADDSLIAGQGRDFAKMQADSILAHGLNPLGAEVNKILSTIESNLNKPGDRAITLNQEVLGSVGDSIKRIQMKYGQVTPEDLYAIRKTEINNVIDKLSADGGSTKKYVSGQAVKVRLAIDEALDQASGGSWKPYIRRYQELSKPLNQMERGQTLLQALESPLGVERKTVFGNAVRKMEETINPLTGRPEIYDLTRPQRHTINKTLKALSDEIDYGKRAQAGAPAVSELLRMEKGQTFPQWFDARITLANAVIRRLEGYGGIKSMRDLGELMLTDPKQLAKLMEKATPKQRRMLESALKQTKAIEAISLAAPALAEQERLKTQQE
jgi:hypothetical protein